MMEELTPEEKEEAVAAGRQGFLAAHDDFETGDTAPNPYPPKTHTHIAWQSEYDRLVAMKDNSEAFNNEHESN